MISCEKGGTGAVPWYRAFLRSPKILEVDYSSGLAWVASIFIIPTLPLQLIVFELLLLPTKQVYLCYSQFSV